MALTSDEPEHNPAIREPVFIRSYENSCSVESLLNKKFTGREKLMQNVSAVRSRRIGEEIETIQMAIGFQGIANQDTDEMEIMPGLLTGHATSLLHDGTTGLSAHNITESSKYGDGT